MILEKGTEGKRSKLRRKHVRQVNLFEKKAKSFASLVAHGAGAYLWFL